MAEGVLLRHLEGGVLTLTLNRPAKRNALNAELVAALAGAFEDAASADDVRVVVLRGAGRDFCSGADLAELERIAAMSREENVEDALRLGRLFLAMRRHPRPVVAAVHGRALAGGCGLATACDLVLVREDASLGYPEVHIGFVPAMVMAILRRRMGEGRAFELVARGMRVDAAEAVRLGLANRVLPAASFDAEVAEYVEALAAVPPGALARTKALLYELGELGFEEGIIRAAERNAEARTTDECRAGVARFLRGRRA